jgi:hypothetical protein
MFKIYIIRFQQVIRFPTLQQAPKQVKHGRLPCFAAKCTLAKNEKEHLEG